MVLGISLFPVRTVESKNRKLENIAGIYGFVGILLAGTGIYIGGGGTLQAYIYITFIAQLLILCLFVLISSQRKKVGHSVLINIISICLVTISFLTYVYYIVASLIY